MSEIGEALGTAAEGGLFARVVGGKFGKNRAPAKAEAEAVPEGACLNCGTELIGEHCHACGQKVHIHRTISAIFHDLVHGVLHLDGKLWTTLPLLTFKPGQITRRYINGERAKFVSPMAMFLFSVFAMEPTFSADTDAINDRKHDHLRGYHKQTMQRIADALPQVDVSGKVVAGSIPDTIVQHLDRGPQALIVMSTHGRGPVSRAAADAQIR